MQISSLAAAAALALTLGAVTAPAHAAPGRSDSAAEVCRQQGYATQFTSYGGEFGSAGECVSYAAQGGTLRSSPVEFPIAAAECEALEGTYEERGERRGSTFLFQCEDGIAVDDQESYAILGRLSEECPATGLQFALISVGAPFTEFVCYGPG